MSITREQVADLREGDVVEVADDSWPGAAVVRGSLVTRDDGSLAVVAAAVYWVCDRQRQPLDCGGRRTLAVVSRAPRPLYVNHPRTEPVPGDVVRTETPGFEFTYLYTGRPRFAGIPSEGRETAWVSLRHQGPDTGPIFAKRLRLLVDGETGQVVPS